MEAVHPRAGPGAEAIALAVATVGLSALVFSRDTNLAYLVFPLLIWAALRFLQPGATAASLAVAAIAVAFTSDGPGPFMGTTPTTARRWHRPSSAWPG